MVLVAIGILAVSCETESLVVKNTPQQNVSANAVLKQNVAFDAAFHGGRQPD